MKLEDRVKIDEYRDSLPLERNRGRVIRIYDPVTQLGVELSTDDAGTFSAADLRNLALSRLKDKIRNFEVTRVREK